MVMTRVGGVGAVQAADVSGAGPVGRVHVTAGLLRADALDLGALNDAEAWRPVKPHVEPAVIAEHHRGASAQDHARARGRQAADVLLAVAAQALVLTVQRRR